MCLIMTCSRRDARMTLQEEEAKAKEPKKDPLEEYCEDNPETDECR